MSLITWTLVLTGGDKDDDNDSESYKIFHRVTEKDNKLSVGQPFDGARSTDLQNVDTYSVQKELYLGGKCEVKDDPDHPWQFWMIMLKNGNMDTSAGLCPKDGKKVGPFPPESRFPCFSKGSCMNQPLVYHNYTDIEDDTTLKGDSTGHGISMLMSPRGWTIFLIIQWLGRRRLVKADGNSIMCSRLPQKICGSCSIWGLMLQTATLEGITIPLGAWPRL